MDMKLKYRGLEGDETNLTAVFTLAHSDQRFSWSRQELEDKYYEQDANEHGFSLPEEEVTLALNEMAGP